MSSHTFKVGDYVRINPDGKTENAGLYGELVFDIGDGYFKIHLDCEIDTHSTPVHESALEPASRVFLERSGAKPTTQNRIDRLESRLARIEAILDAGEGDQ